MGSNIVSFPTFFRISFAEESHTGLDPQTFIKQVI